MAATVEAKIWRKSESTPGLAQGCPHTCIKIAVPTE